MDGCRAMIRGVAVRLLFFFFFSSRRRHTRFDCDWSSDVCSSDLFREAANGGWRGSSEYKDVVAGARYLQGLPYVDRKRIGIWGGSYGGLLTALALARNSDIFSAGVDSHGVHDWSALLAGRAGGAPDAKEAGQLGV